MCGILCILGPQPPQPLTLDALEARGPDAHHVIYGENFALGFTRLKIVDLKTGMQPFEKSNLTYACNGEIYNHASLERKHHLTLESRSDCECLGPLYRLLGPTKLYNALDGVFAFIIIDGDTVILGRDRIGVRPLFIGYTSQGYLAIASLAAALNFCTDVQQFMPGLAVIHENKYMTRLGHVPRLQLMSDPIYEIQPTLIAAVQKRLMSDRPMACLLSGGLDSSLVAAILCKLSPTTTKTYSIGMEGSTDLKAARKVAQYLGTEHTEVTFTPQEGLDIIPEVIRVLESYDVTTVRASIGMHLLARYIKRETKDTVIFSGEGSDELFCGYLYFHNAPTPSLAALDSRRLQNELYMYDVLRADRCISSCGLELRVPFLDKDMINLVHNLTEHQITPTRGYEKFILRQAFEGFLPPEILWRRKEGMSDGTGSLERPLSRIIQEFVPQLDDLSPVQCEEHYYREIFNKIYPFYHLCLPRWMPRWTNTDDPSGREVAAFSEPTPQDHTASHSEKCANNE
uniref:asparagine synthase (glutamine-hydrolyzing) n=1 Tax=viral metagenome TaxID=1070528 RepID=A0A6C0BP71_9ZZZZ